MAIEHREGHKSRADFPLGNDDDFFTFALDTRLGPTDQLVSAFGSHQDEPKLAIDALWKFHWISFVHLCKQVDWAQPELDAEIDWTCRTGDES